MNILQIHTRYRRPGGEDTVVSEESALLEQGGHQVRQFIRDNPSRPVETAASLSVSPWNPIVLRQLARILDEYRPDVAHIHNTWFATSPSVLAALRRAGIPVVMTLHNFRLTCGNGLLFRDGSPCELCLDGSILNCVRYRCYRGALGSVAAATTIGIHRASRTWSKNVDVFVALTEFARRIFIRSGIEAEKLVVKPNFTSDPGIRDDPPSRSRDVLFVGRLSVEKGIHDLVDAWRDRGAHLGLNLLIVGEGPVALDLGGSAGSIRLLGRLPTDEVRQLMLRSRALVFPSVWFEGQPMVLLEAFAAGLPTLVIGTGGHVETASLLGSGWVCSDRSRLAELLSVLSDDAEIDRAGERARSAFDSLFSRESGLENLEALYSLAIERRRVRSQD